MQGDLKRRFYRTQKDGHEHIVVADANKTDKHRKCRATRTLVLCLGFLLLLHYFFSSSKQPSGFGSFSYDELAYYHAGELERSHRRNQPRTLPPLAHVVRTRFMQEQGELAHLAQARFLLWKSICLPSMLAQRTDDVDIGRRPDFAWIIKVDPKLPHHILRDMIELVRDAPHVFIVASNTSFRSDERQLPGAWKDGAEANDLVTTRAKIYTGDRALLSRLMAYATKPTIIWLESILDADDGLVADFVTMVQQDALSSFAASTAAPSSSSTLQWKYWCVPRGRVLEWRWQPDERHRPGSAGQLSHAGQLFPFCPTAGLTVGYAPGVRERDVPMYYHTEILTQIPHHGGCGQAPEHCLGMVQSNLTTFDAIRSRTPTSAGMHQVTRKVGIVPTHKEPRYWQDLATYYGIQQEHMRAVNAFFTTHMYEIARDNLLGQCTPGHSCKDEAKTALREFMKAHAGNQTKERT